MPDHYVESLRLAELDAAWACLTGAQQAVAAVSDVDVPLLLEVGSGAGWQARALAERGYRVEAIDIESCLHADERVWPVVSYDGHKIPFDDGHFDILFSSNVLEHIPHIDEFQKEMMRVLKPEGVAVHLMPNLMWRFWKTLWHYPMLFRAAVRMFGRRLGGEGTTPPQDVDARLLEEKASRMGKAALLKRALVPSPHGEFGNAFTEMYYFSPGRWRKLFTDAGWEVLQCAPSGLFYTGWIVLGSRLSIERRKQLSYLFGSACHIYVLRKKKA